jgi:hypothetical protein
MTDCETNIKIAALLGITVCSGCWHQIQEDICHCGDPIKSHGAGSGHAPVPMGCTCGYLDAPERKAATPECPDYCEFTRKWKEESPI